MKTYSINSIGQEKLDRLFGRASCKRNRGITSLVKKILRNVQKSGDKALFAYTEQFDCCRLNNICVQRSETAGSAKIIPQALKRAIGRAILNISAFHKAQKRKEISVATMPGVKCFQKILPIDTVGLYVPGGTAPLFSTVLMLAIPAKLAGCTRIILCTPPGKDGAVASEILYVAQVCGIREIYTVGGAQAIAAMAYGTETIPKVDKIFGPGNQFVTAAKMIVASENSGVAIDMPAGPSEVLVIADSSANPAFIASDLLSQAEHGPDSQTILITTDSSLMTMVKKEISKQIVTLPRREIAMQSLQKSFLFLANSIDESIVLSNRYAPEHLILQVRNPEKWVNKIRNAGSVFLGRWSPESVGDYASGTNHTLPTSGYARSVSGLSLESFQKTITFQKLTKKGLSNIASAVIEMADSEKLEAHGNAVKIRLLSQKS